MSVMVMAVLSLKDTLSASELYRYLMRIYTNTAVKQKHIDIMFNGTTILYIARLCSSVIVDSVVLLTIIE